MIEAKMEELMWLEIDASISDEDHRTLQTYLETHPEAREHFQQLREMCALFGEEGDIDPPPQLRARILDSLETASPLWARAASDRSVWDRIRGIFTPRPVWKLAAAVVTGVFVGIIGYHVFTYNADTDGPLDKSRLTGTMGLRWVPDEEPTVDIDLPGASGALTVERDGSHVVSKLNVQSLGEIEVVLDYDGPALQYGGNNLALRSSNLIAVEDRGFRVRNRGEGTYYFSFKLHDDPMAPLVVKILAEDQVLLEETVYPEHTAKK